MTVRRILPSYCTAFSKAFTVNSFPWRIPDERTHRLQSSNGENYLLSSKEKHLWPLNTEFWEPFFCRGKHWHWRLIGFNANQNWSSKDNNNNNNNNTKPSWFPPTPKFVCGRYEWNILQRFEKCPFFSFPDAAANPEKAKYLMAPTAAEKSLCYSFVNIFRVCKIFDCEQCIVGPHQPFGCQTLLTYLSNKNIFFAMINVASLLKENPHNVPGMFL